MAKPKQQSIQISVIGEHEALAYAGSQLKKYIECMTDRHATVVQASSYDADEEALYLGLPDAMPGSNLPGVADPAFDDAVAIEINGLKGAIVGSNPRSVLIGVYRYLSACGCRWIRPGPDGEFIPRVDLSDKSVEVCEAASYRHRGICIEGAVSYEHVRDIIEWAPRVGFNNYFIQFREGYTFFDRWYAHTDNPVREPEAFSVDRAKALVSRIGEEIKKRDLLYHAVGHGWTCEPFGVQGLGWEYPPVEATPEVSPYLALVDGKRDFWDGIPLNTNLCYSNPEVRRIITEEIAGYAQTYPAVDVLHFWLADGSNNNCECEACRKARPADFYVKMLNEVDALLSEKGLNTRIVFLIYVDLLWPPLEEKIQNPERFILMFAPITRSYSRAFTTDESTPEIPPFVLNKLQFPQDVDANVAFLREWQKIFSDDSFDFDYHYMWDHHLDPGYTQIARILCEDIKNLRDLGMDGFMSCQIQRSFFPSGQGMVLMGWALWNRSLDFEVMTEDYFAHAFGPEGNACRAYLENLTRLFDPVYLRGEKPGTDNEALVLLKEIPGVVEKFRPVIEKNIHLDNTCWSASWKYLAHHADFAESFARVLIARAQGDLEQAQELWASLTRMLWEREDSLHPVFDTWNFVRTIERRLELGGRD